MTFTLDQVVLVSTVPLDDPNGGTSHPSNTYKHTNICASKKTVSAINAGSEASGQVYCLELTAGDAFGVKVSPFTYKDSSIPINCMSNFPSTAFAADSNLLAYHPTLSALFLYAAGKDRPVSRSFGHERIAALQASPCGRFAAAGTESGCLIVWKIGSGDLVAVIDGAHFQAIRVIRFSPDGQTLATGGSDALVKIWSWPHLISSSHESSKSPATPLFTFTQHAAPITQLVFSLTLAGKGRILSSSLDCTCNLYDLVDGQLLFSLSLPTAVTSATLNASETILYAASVEGIIYTVNLNGTQTTPALQSTLKFHKGPISSLQWSIDERVLISASAEDGTVAFWDSLSHQLLKSVVLTSKKVACTNIIVIGKSDPSHSQNNIEISATPFKRLGNSLVSLSSSAPLSPLPECTQIEAGVSDTKDQIKMLAKENDELRQINAELCELACEIN